MTNANAPRSRFLLGNNVALVSLLSCTNEDGHNKKNRPQIEPKGKGTLMRSLIWNAALCYISVIHGVV